MTERSAFTFSFCTGLMSAVMRMNNQQGELFRQLALAMSCDERRIPSELPVMIMGILSAEKK